MIWRYNAYISLCKLNSSGAAGHPTCVGGVHTCAALLAKSFLSGRDNHENLGNSFVRQVLASLQNVQSAQTAAGSRIRGYSALHDVLHYESVHSCNEVSSSHLAANPHVKQVTHSYHSTSFGTPTNSLFGRSNAASALLKSILDVPGSYAMLRAQLERSLLPQLLQKFTELCMSRQHSFTANQASDLLWALCNTKPLGLSSSLVESLQSIVAQGVTMCDRDHVIAALFAVNQTTPCNLQVVSALSDRVWELGPKLTARQVAVAASSLAEMSHNGWEDEHLPEVLATLAARAREVILDFTPTELMYVMKAMALARHPDELLFREATEALLLCLQKEGDHSKGIPQQLTDIHCSDVAAALAACAVVRHHNPAFFRSATDWLLSQPLDGALHAARQQELADDAKAERARCYDWEPQSKTANKPGMGGQLAHISLIQDAADSAASMSIAPYHQSYNRQPPATTFQPLQKPSEKGALSQEAWLQSVLSISTRQLGSAVKQPSRVKVGSRALITTALEGSGRVLDPRLPEATPTLCMLSKQWKQSPKTPHVTVSQAVTSEHERVLTPEALVTAVWANAAAGEVHGHLYGFAGRLFSVVNAPTISMHHAAMLMSAHAWTAPKPKPNKKGWKGVGATAQFTVGIPQLPAAFVSYMHHHMADQKLKKPYLTKLQSAMQALGYTPVVGVTCSFDGLLPISLAYAITTDATTSQLVTLNPPLRDSRQNDQKSDPVSISAVSSSSSQHISGGLQNPEIARNNLVEQQKLPVTSFMGTKPVAVEVVLESDCLASPLHHVNGPTTASHPPCKALSSIFLGYRLEAMTARGWVVMTVMQHECDALPPNDSNAWVTYTAAKLQLCLSKA